MKSRRLSTHVTLDSKAPLDRPLAWYPILHPQPGLLVTRLSSCLLLALDLKGCSPRFHWRPKRRRKWLPSASKTQGTPPFRLAWSSGYKLLRLPSPLAGFNDLLLLIPTPQGVKVFEKQILPLITAYISPIKFPILPAKTFAAGD